MSRVITFILGSEEESLVEEITLNGVLDLLLANGSFQVIEIEPDRRVAGVLVSLDDGSEAGVAVW
jgi:hypothetical protein